MPKLINISVGCVRESCPSFKALNLGIITELLLAYRGRDRRRSADRESGGPGLAYKIWRSIAQAGQSGRRLYT